jgi:hypothetical protein
MLRPRQDLPQHEWIVIYTASNIPEAQIVAGRLHAEGIQALVNYPIGGTAIGVRLGSISVLVHPDDAQAAHEILFTEDDEMTEELPEGYEDALYDWRDFEISSGHDENDDDYNDKSR